MMTRMDKYRTYRRYIRQSNFIPVSWLKQKIQEQQYNIEIIERILDDWRKEKTALN